MRAAYKKLASEMVSDFLLEGLKLPPLALWSDDAVASHSKKTMQVFAASNGIEVIEIGVDHAERAWERYFAVAPPFNPDSKRQDRRKDIPDSWILEAAIDLKAKYPNLRALCCDKQLSDALNASDIETDYGTPEKAGELTGTLLDQLAAELAPPAPAVQESPDEPCPVASSEPGLDAVLAELQSEHKNLEVRVLGYVAYLETPAKDQLFDLLRKSGVPVEMARNVAERLVLAKLIVDTGNHYLAADREAGDQAAARVEAEIIELLESDA